jgi:general secretion pathway protein A
MYKEFYGFTTYPFSLTPEPEFLYLSKKHENCLRYLLYGLERGHGLIVLTGKIGTGKTLLLNILMKSLDETTHKALLANSKLEFLDILRYVSHALGLEISGISKAELLINLENFLLTCAQKTEKVVIILDEAQNLSVDALEEIRLLTNFEHHGRKLLQIILVGQPQLQYVLQSSQLTQLTQRIGFNCQLLPLDYPETKSYIERRLAVAGAVYPVFTEQAIKQIFVSSKGIPRVINLISDTALLFGFGEETRTIGRTIIRQVMQELDLYSPEKSLRPVAIHRRGEHEPHASGITADRDRPPLEYSVPSSSPEGMKQGEQRQSQRYAGRPRRLALVVGLTGLSLLGAGLVLQSSLTGRELGAYVANAVPRFLTGLWPNPGVREAPPLAQSSGIYEPPLLPPNPGVRGALLSPPNPGVREAPLLPQSPGVHRLPRSVQWVQTSVFDQFLPGKPLTVSLPHLQRTPEGLPVTVTLEVADSAPRWLRFDPEKLVLSGTAPPQEVGKKYHLTFRARTADGLESVLQFVLAVTEHTRL